MSHRYYCESPISGETLTLTGSEAHHLARVMRLPAGDCVTLFDGHGSEWHAVIEQVDKRQVVLKLVERLDIDRELPFRLSIACALPKGDRQKVLVEKLVELGIARLIPLVTERGVAQPVDKALERLRRGVIEASKQCERNRLMEIAPALPLSKLVATSEDATRLIAHPQGDSLSTTRNGTGPILVAIGPEGGFTHEEVQAAIDAGWRKVGLGPRILRVETAAIAIAACLGLPHDEASHGS